MVSQDDRNMAILAWVLALVSGWIGPLVMVLVMKERPFVYRHAANALCLQIVTFIAILISIPLIFVLIGLLLLPVVAIAHLIFGIMGAVAASKGEQYDPPMVAGLTRSIFKV